MGSMIESEMRSGAEKILLNKVSEIQSRIASIFEGREKEAVIEVFRLLDLMFVSQMLGGHVDEDARLRAYYVRCGVPEALAPILAKAHERPRGVPWGKSHELLGSLIATCLEELGKLVDLLRLVRISAHGVATVEVKTKLIQITTTTDAKERFARRLLKSSYLEQPPKGDLPTEAVKERMRLYVRHDDVYHIAYESDSEIVSQHLQLAEGFRSRFPESEAIPENSIIGGRPFKAWRRECERALGRTLAHINFSLLLCQDRPATRLRDVLTMFCTKADAAAVLNDGEGAEVGGDQVLRALTLEPEDLEEWSKTYEPPASQYVSLDRDFVLIPCFGMLGNPYYAMFRHIRKHHRKDWDKAVDAREGVFREDLASIFPAPRYVVPRHGYKLKRSDGTHLTDIDAVIMDCVTGSVALVQLKWHDPYGRSISERESRRKNLARATDWVDKVNEWVGGRTCAEISCALQLPPSECTRSPEVFVISRYAARFAGDDRVDSGATWLSWPELKYVVAHANDDPIRDVAKLSEEMLIGEVEGEVIPFTRKFQFGDLGVTLQVG
ncbi:hypothetical protein ACUZUJ_19630 [Stenotrophomonas sp. S4]